MTGVVLERLGGGRFEDDDVRLLGVVYRVEFDGPFTFADGEVVEAMFVGLADLEEQLRRDRFVPDSVALALPWLGLAAHESSRAMSEHLGPSWMPDSLQPEQADLLVEQARMMLGEDRRLLRRARSP